MAKIQNLYDEHIPLSLYKGRVHGEQLDSNDQKRLFAFCKFKYCRVNDWRRHEFEALTKNSVLDNV